MRKTLGKVLAANVALGIFAAAVQALPIEFTMQVVEVNGSSITPTTNLNVSPGDRLTIDLFLENWSPEVLRTYQFGIDTLSFENGVGQPLELARIDCNDNGDCLSNVCMADGADMICSCQSSIFVDTGRPSWIMAPVSQALSTAACNTAATIANDVVFVGGLGVTQGVTDPMFGPRYAGTMIIDVPTGGCDEYVIAIKNNPNFTFARNSNSVPITNVDLSATITLTAGACPIQFLDSEPQFCAIDPKQPHPVDSTSPAQGISQVDVEFNIAQPGLSASDFALLSFDPVPVPSVDDVATFDGGKTYTVTFSGPISPQANTCIVYINSAPPAQGCFSYMPGDVDQNRVSNEADMTRLLDALSDGGTPLPMMLADINRSGAQGPQDILRLMDMMNGGGAYDVWQDEILSFCPQ